MIDPLQDFDWQSLYAEYDEKCARAGRYKENVSALKCFSPPPKKDRELYYSLLSRISSERKTGSLMTLQTYAAIIYWKMYSTSPKTNNDIDKDINLQERLKKRLQPFSNYPTKIAKDRKLILKLVERTLENKPYGMRLPVCTAVLHYLYPNVVPIFDQMVLQAIGYSKDQIKSRQLNQSQELYNEYLDHHWSMVEKYSNNIRNFQEKPVRVVEMALWITRGNKDKK